MPEHSRLCCGHFQRDRPDSPSRIVWADWRKHLMNDRRQPLSGPCFAHSLAQTFCALGHCAKALIGKPSGRTSCSISRTVSRSDFAHSDLCEVLPTPWFHASFHAVISRIIERVKCSPGQVRMALVAGWYAAKVRIAEGVRAASSHPRFAPLVRSAGANPAVNTTLVNTSVNTESRHLAWYPKAWYPLWYPRIPTTFQGCQTRSFHCGCHGIAVFSTG